MRRHPGIGPAACYAPGQVVTHDQDLTDAAAMTILGGSHLGGLALAFGLNGNLWIATDGNALGTNDGLFAVPVKGAERGHVKQFLTVPIGGETCGPIITEERILIAAQHPGERDGATAEKPTSVWPDGSGSIPRPSVVTVWKERRR